jgi:hypothetical protein
MPNVIIGIFPLTIASPHILKARDFSIQALDFSIQTSKLNVQKTPGNSNPLQMSQPIVLDHATPSSACQSSHTALSHE